MSESGLTWTSRDARDGNAGPCKAGVWLDAGLMGKYFWGRIVKKLILGKCISRANVSAVPEYITPRIYYVHKTWKERRKYK